MLYDTNDVAKELAAQLHRTDLGVTDARLHKVVAENTFETLQDGVIFRLDNGQEFLLEVSRWGGPRA